MRDGVMQYSEELARLWGVALEEAAGNVARDSSPDRSAADDEGAMNNGRRGLLLDGSEYVSL